LTKFGVVSAWRDASQFTLKSLSTPILLGPNTVTEGAIPTFTWNGVPGADFYDLWVNDTGTGQSPVLRNSHVAVTSFSANLTLGHLYQWWVRALNTSGNMSSWSAPATFQIALAVPTLAGP